MTEAKFNLSHQKVGRDQYIAGGDMHFGGVQNAVDLVAELEKLKGEFTKAKDSGLLSEETATDAEYQVTKAVHQAKQPQPDKKTLLNHLNTAKSLIEGVTVASGLVTALATTAEAVQKLFS